jgi:hypothetical protein
MRILVPAALLLALACDRSGPEALIRKRFEACVKAVEAGDAAGAGAALGPRFSGPDGMDRGTARLFLMGVLRRERIGVTVLGQKLEVRGREAAQTVELLLTSRTGASLLPGESSRRTFLILWEERDGDWQIRELQDLQGS